MINRLSLLLVLSVFPLIVTAGKIDVEVLSRFQNGNKASVLIEFYGHPEFRAGFSGMTKSEKGNSLYHDLTTIAEISQENIKEYLSDRDISFNSFYIVNAISAEISYEQALEIATYPEVKKVMPDFIEFNILPEIAQGSREVHLRSEYTYGLELLSVPEFWEVTSMRGAGVVIGGQDTGYDWEHPALKLSYRGFDIADVNHNYSWHDAIHTSFDTTRLNPCGFDTSEPCDDHGHGTHTMGTIAGQDVSDKIFGIAPDAQWIGCRNMEGGKGKPSTYLECFEWFLAPTDLNGENPIPEMAPDIINNSWVCTVGEGCNLSNFHLLEQAVNNLTAAGILVVASAGNGGRGGCGTVLNPPAIFKNSFSIGAVDAERDIAIFSSRGPVVVDSSYRIKPNVVAPGVSTYSAYPYEQYRNLSGTSMAGPHAAGMAALLISAYPELKGNPLEVIRIMQKTSLPLKPDTLDCYKDEIPNNTWGYGLINSMSALDYLEATKKSSTQSYIFFPTLAGDYIYISKNRYNRHKSASEIQIWNSLGQFIGTHSFKGQHHQINVTAYAHGTYFYRISDGQSVSTGKFIKLR